MSGGEQIVTGDGPYKDRDTQTGIIKLIARHAKEFQNLKPEELKQFEQESEKFCNAMSPGGMAAWNPVDYHNAWQLYLNSTGAQELGILDMTKLRVISANMGPRSNMQIRTDTSLPGIYGTPQGSEYHDPMKVDLVGFDRISMAMALMTAKFEERNGEEVAVCLYPLLKKDGSCEGFVRVIMSDLFKNPADNKPHKYPVYSQFQNFIHAAVGEKIIEDQNAYRAMMLGNTLEAQGIKEESRYLKIILDQVFRNREGFVRIEGESMKNSDQVLKVISNLTSDTKNISHYLLGGTYADKDKIVLHTRNKPNVSGTGYSYGENMDPETDPWIEKCFIVYPGSEFIPLESMEVAIKYPITHANGNVVLAIPEFDRRGNLYTVRFRQFTHGDVKKFNELIDGNKKDNPHHYEPIILSKKNKQ